jgi:hypothetical protein
MELEQQHHHQDPPKALPMPIIVVRKHDGLLWPVASRCLA